MRKIITSMLLASAVVSSGAAFARGASNSDTNQDAIAQSEVDFRAQENPGYVLNTTPPQRGTAPASGGGHADDPGAGGNLAGLRPDQPVERGPA